MKGDRPDLSKLGAWSNADIEDCKLRLARLVLERHWTKDSCPRWVLEAWAQLLDEQNSRYEQLSLFNA